MGKALEFFRIGFHHPEIAPLFVVLGVALGSAGLMGYHQAHSPDVVWKHQAHERPWLDVKPGDQVKLAAFNQKYERKYHRESL